MSDAQRSSAAPVAGYQPNASTGQCTQPPKNPSGAQVSPRLEVSIPKVPNFLRTFDDRAVDVAELSERDLLKVAADWTKLLLANAETRRTNRRARA